MSILFSLLAAPFLLVTLFFILEVAAGLPRGRCARSTIAPPTAVIIVPANNEAMILLVTLAGLQKATLGAADILLVADNCSDATAAIARSMAVDVIERHDPENRGKGFALDFARAHLAKSPPEVVVILDADCSIDQASLLRLVQSASGTQRPAQAINLLRPANAGSSPLVQLSTFAFLIKNLVRQRGLQRLSGGVHLTGTGMALPWRLFESSVRPTSSIVEDLELGLELARQGQAAQLVLDANVWSEAATRQGSMSQRRRWERGFLATAARVAPAQLSDAIRKGDPRRLCAALDLCVPPAALLLLLNGVMIMIEGAALASGAIGWPLVTLHLLVVAAALLALSVAWWREGREFIGIGGLLQAPLYVAWKLPMYLGLGRGELPGWLRSGR